MNGSPAVPAICLTCQCQRRNVATMSVYLASLVGYLVLEFLVQVQSVGQSLVSRVVGQVASSKKQVAQKHWSVQECFVCFVFINETRLSCHLLLSL